MNKNVNTIIIGGGCLGCASAISISNRLEKISPQSNSVCIVEKSLVGSGISAKHSGIARAANAVPVAAKFAREAIDFWKNLESLWGVKCDHDSHGAIWIARDAGNGKNEKWTKLSETLGKLDIDFRQVDLTSAQAICGDSVTLYDDEIFFHEPDAIQFDPSKVRKTLYKALKKNNIESYENTEVKGFLQNESGEIKTVITSAGNINCDHVINAAGPWSPNLFKSIGLSIPVSTEPVNVINWLTSIGNTIGEMPIIADYTNLAYFRSWHDGEIHMHQPRRRNVKETARIFSEYPLQNRGAEFVNEPANHSLGYSEITIFKDIARKRFRDIKNEVYGSGYRSYFDITPDLKFILGKDNVVNNLYHCLGSGQAFKYTPLLGEIMADCIAGEGKYLSDIDEFSISRFDKKYMEYFWKQVAGDEHSLGSDDAVL